MKTLKFTSLALLIMALASFTGVSLSYSSSNDDNHLSANDSVYSPPGYMNKDIQQARSLTDKYLANKDKADNKTEATQREVSQKVQTQAVEKPKPQLKQKQSSSNAAKSKQTIGGITTKIGDSTNYNVPIENGKVPLEQMINGVRHLFVGFESGGYAKADLQTVINQVAGTNSVIILRGDVGYSGVTLASGIKLYGGYDASGNRDIENHASIINGTASINNVQDVEINGITFNSSSNFNITINSSSNVNILYNTFNNNYTLPAGVAYVGSDPLNTGISIDSSLSSSSVVLTNNTFNSTGSGIYVNGQLTNDFAIALPPPGPGKLGSSQVIHTVTGNISNVTSMYNNYNATIGISAKGVSNISSNGDYFKTIPLYTSFIEIGGVSGTPNYSQSNSSTGYNLGMNYNTILVPEFTTNSPYFLTNNIFSANDNYMRSMLLSENNELIDIFYKNTANDSALSSFFNGNNGKELAKIIESSLSPATSYKTVSENQYALTAPIASADNSVREGTDAASRLTNIFKNPSEDQKAILDVLKTLLGDTEKAQDALADQSPELKKASDDLLQMVANILLAQAVPDLLNKGDVSNIKAIFSELDTQRNKIMLEYAQSTKPYYENMIKDMAKNMAMLQAKNLLNPNMSKDELSKLPPSELDKILDKIRNMKDKSFEEKYLLQQEAKYRQDYLDPNNKKLESDMKGMLKNFTGRINDVLKSSEKK